VFKLGASTVDRSFTSRPREGPLHPGVTRNGGDALRMNFAKKMDYYVVYFKFFDCICYNSI
jgi:hypothetical protein